MQVIFSSNLIENKSKNSVLEDFLLFTKNNASLTAEIDGLITDKLTQDNSQVFLLLGDYYLSESKKKRHCIITITE